MTTNTEVEILASLAVRFLQVGDRIIDTRAEISPEYAGVVTITAVDQFRLLAVEHVALTGTLDGQPWRDLFDHPDDKVVLL